MAAASNRTPNIGLCIELANSLQENKPLADVERVVQGALEAGESIENLVNGELYDGPNAYESNFRGASCFHIAVTHNAHEEVIQFLCNQGDDLEAQNSEGKML